MNKEDALENLILAKIALGNKHWWLEAGTCLGAVREQDFIEHDLDIDLGILEEDFDWGLVDSFLEKGFTLRNIFGFRHFGLEIRFERYGIPCDLFLFYKYKDWRWHAAWNNGMRQGLKNLIPLAFPAAMIEKRKVLDFKGYDLPVPADTLGYLEARYGKDWKTPNKNWNWATDPKCIHKELTKELCEPWQ